ncbi:MAG: hypothetical protein GF308_09135 [Candidatus Heimdallarchaeota archaeon]|nr:hypothetical protein [Candidatus Heimdallarchaeota archaeon]
MSYAEKKEILMAAIDQAKKADYKFVMVKTATLTDYTLVTDMLLMDSQGNVLFPGFILSFILSDLIRTRIHAASFFYPVTLDPPLKKKECKKAILAIIKEMPKKNNLEVTNVVTVIGFEDIIGGRYIDSDSELAFLKAFLELSKKIVFIIADPHTSFGRSVPAQLFMHVFSLIGPRQVTPKQTASSSSREILDEISSYAQKIDLGKMAPI